MQLCKKLQDKKNKEVMLVISYPLIANPRAEKIVRSLSKRFKVLILEWNREGIVFQAISLENVSIRRFNMRAPYGKLTLIFYYPVFWMWVAVNVLLTRPGIIHACNLDALIPCVFSKILTRSKLIFDSFDKFSLAFVPPKMKLLFKLVDLTENVLTKVSNAFITTSNDRLITWGKYLPKYTITLFNAPDDVSKFIVDNKSKLLKNVHDEFAIVYAGRISRDRGLILLKTAIRGLEGVRLVLAGRIVDDSVRKEMRDSKIHYCGLLPYEDALRIQAYADVIPILYDPAVPINRFANPSKLFEAMMLRVPVITNVCRDIVAETECGLIVDYDAKEVRKAILQLKSNPSLRKKLGENGRRAFIQKYNWDFMEKRLLWLYYQLM